MGMFDSFYVDKVEVQTKSLDCSLNTYHIGDYVPSYEGNFDGPASSFYLIEDAYPSQQWYGLIIINNIFIDAVVSDEKLITRQRTKELFTTYQTQSHIKSLKLEDIIKEGLSRDRKRLQQTLNQVKHACKEYVDFKTDLQQHKFRLFSKYHDAFEQGDKLETVIDRILLESENRKNSITTNSIDDIDTIFDNDDQGE